MALLLIRNHLQAALTIAATPVVKQFHQRISRSFSKEQICLQCVRQDASSKYVWKKCVLKQDKNAVNLLKNTYSFNPIRNSIDNFRRSFHVSCHSKKQWQ